MDAEELYKQANALEAERKHTKALPIYKELIKDSEDPRFYIAYGACLQQLGHWEQSIPMFEKGIGDDEKLFVEIAQSLNLNMEKFKADFNSLKSQEKIRADILEGNRLNIDGTPTVFLNGKKVRELSQKKINFLVKYLSH